MDLKNLGYLVSTLSVFFLGVVAWPDPGEPHWKTLAVSVGMAASVIGIFLRYLSHRQEKREIERIERAERER